MAVSRERFASISDLQLPFAFIKERPFETLLTQQRVRHDTQNETKECRSFEQKPYVVNITEDCCIPEKENYNNLYCSGTEVSNLENFVPHQRALERFRKEMRVFLQREAGKLVQQPPEEMSSQEMETFRHTTMVAFRTYKIIKLNELLDISFFHEICLRRIQNIASEELEPLREAILETEEIVHRFQETLLSKHQFTLENQSEHEILCDSLLEGERKVEFLFQKSVFFQGQLPSEDAIRYVAWPESKIIYALGLEIDFLDRLKLSDDKLSFHWSLQEWILNFLSDNYEDIDDDELKSKPLSKELLVKLGFRDNSKAIQTIIHRFGLLSGHVEPVEFVKRFVKDELKYNPVLSQNLFRFPFREKAINVCYKLKSLDNLIDVINVERSGGSEEVYEHYIAEYSDTASVVLFHGTDHYSALDIISRGIDVNLGLSKRDFSDGFGFYLTNDYKHSQTWSFSQTRKPAVLVFKVPKSFLENQSSLGLSGEKEKTDWTQIVTKCRSGRPSKKIRNKLKNYDIIQGPISKPSANMRDTFEPREGSHQLCVVNEDCADEFQNFLAAVLFFD